MDINGRTTEGQNARRAVDELMGSQAQILQVQKAHGLVLEQILEHLTKPEELVATAAPIESIPEPEVERWPARGEVWVADGGTRKAFILILHSVHGMVWCHRPSKAKLFLNPRKSEWGISTLTREDVRFSWKPSSVEEFEEHSKVVKGKPQAVVDYFKPASSRYWPSPEECIEHGQSRYPNGRPSAL